VDGLRLLHSMGDTFELTRTLEDRTGQRRHCWRGLHRPGDGRGPSGLRADGHPEQLPEVLPTVDPSLGALVKATLEANDIEVRTSTTVQHIAKAPAGSGGRLQVGTVNSEGAVCRAPSPTWSWRSSGRPGILDPEGVLPTAGLAGELRGGRSPRHGGHGLLWLPAHPGVLPALCRMH
jgi:hypothetical protein